MKRWDDGTLLGQSLCGLWPENPEFWLKTAYCQHELRLTQAAKDTLLAAPLAIREVPIYSYNLACYEAQLGLVPEAKRLLKICFMKDKALRTENLEDPDLSPVWDSLDGL